MPDVTKRAAILSALRDRVAGIRTVHGYSTNAGEAVFLGVVPTLGPDDPPAAVALVPGEDEVAYQGEKVFIRLPVQIAALARVDQPDPWMQVEAVIGDIKRAMETSDRMAGGLMQRHFERVSTVTLEREPGSTTIGAAIVYRVPYTELWGTP